MANIRRTAELETIGAALLFSTGGAAIKVDAFSGMQVSCVRAGIASVALLFWWRRRLRWSWPAVAVGVAYAATLTLFVTSTKLTTAANAIFLQSTAPLYLVLLSPLLIGEPVRARDLAYLAAVAAGLAACFFGRVDATVTAPDPATGNVLGVLCGIAWAFTLMGLRWGQRAGQELGATAVVAGNVIAFGLALPFALPLPSATAGEWTTLVYLGVCQIGVAYVWLTSAMAHLPALEASLLLLLEPVLNPVWTWIVRGENPGAWVAVGGAVIIAATAAKMIADSRQAVVSGAPD
jgi:drug/metabolite transporter (DMT)-like permease